jgi:hypothetical protein
LVHISQFNESAFNWITNPDPTTNEIMQCRCILLEPRKIEHVDQGLHLAWLNQVLQVSSNSNPGGTILILVRETAHNIKLINRINNLLEEEKKVYYIINYYLKLIGLDSAYYY